MSKVATKLTSNGILNDANVNVNGCIRPITPIPNKMSKMFAPLTSPIPISASFFKAEIIPADRSGNEVPILITNKPIMAGDTDNAKATKFPVSTSRNPETIKLNTANGIRV